ncbi:hypothetical protein COY65_01935 [Candidatus Jorgensenbacteria bacterium CG_4_10_14_0_8_um_filter_39_13]|uniref:Mg2 transporter protein CorA family protein n=2 Tax=Candidatus Joergenseniibacteriota TaxID=1752739 RepID=A0A2M7RGV8_9BACT|nr:MAG: hypothetical protein COV54_00965 [Candidatus Jorgensenbacteria bacterium CG11_big_fil_rev_8_21_14_0_20_38_23]PIV13089.1 MAG: hypothetical protein COS46_02135 [Candidatus Jorgensenbacteria bacterium CG03_land_8_20_14_0_80_38_39]PIW97915.1 MAG: hypothetical protein COZ81_00050 [Candidatus Jorgensenbacteria bacterium CG_4_8_14_3_um_filter_38_10]PIY95934.1 MAG: hypothetical protein COY65_01935 [Candidatus Jorgensenbacteria bacterium CG_4_10_14_0_8_um_filter_39_13]PJA94770.1 MAG: hypothetica
MKTFALNKNLKWLDFLNPSKKETDELKKIYDFHPLILEELLRPSDRTKVERYNGYLFIVYHLPIYDQAKRSSRRAEIDLLATKSALITVHYEDLESIEQFERYLASDISVRQYQSTAELICRLLRMVNEFSQRELKHIEKKTNAVGEKLFKNQDRELFEEISYIKRDILGFFIITAPQRHILESLMQEGINFWGEKFRPYFMNLLGDFSRVNYLLENLRVSIESYSQTVSQILEFKTSEVVRRFSVLAFLTFPLLIYFTMTLNLEIFKSFTAHPPYYWLSAGFVLILIIVLAFIFRKKGWL